MQHADDRYNQTFAETLEWLAWMIETDQFGQVTPATLRARAAGIYDMIRDDGSRGD